MVDEDFVEYIKLVSKTERALEKLYENSNRRDDSERKKHPRRQLGKRIRSAKNGRVRQK